MRSTHTLFGALDDADIDWLAEVSRPRRFESGDVLIREGAPLSSLWLIYSGGAVVTTETLGMVARARAGELLGEVGFVDGAPATASVAADGPVEALETPHAAIETRLAADAGFAARFYKAVSEFLAWRLRATMAAAPAAGYHFVERDDAAPLPAEARARVEALMERLRARLAA